MAVISAGKLIPALGDYGVPWYGQWEGNNGVISLMTRAASYGQIYAEQPWIYAIITKIARSGSRLPFKIYEKDGESRDPIPDSPFGQLMRNPNPRDSAVFFWLWTFSTFELFGEAMWVKKRDASGQVAQVWPMNPANIEVRRTDDYDTEYRHWATDQTWLSRDVVHFKSFNPKDTQRGLSALEPLRTTLTSEEAIRKAQEAIWANGARPSVVLEHPKDIGQSVARRLRADWERMQAGVENWGRTAILEEGMKANVIQLTGKDMEVTEIMKLSREEACGVLDVPPPVVHILDHATFSNITEQMRSMYRDTMAPRLQLFESVVNSQLRPDFDLQGNTYGEFLLDEVLRGDFESRVDGYQKAINSGWMTPGEVRQLENLPEIEDANRLYINATVVPMSSQPTTPEQRRGNQPNQLENLAPYQISASVVDVEPLLVFGDAELNRHMRNVAGRMPDSVTPDTIDIDRLVNGLPDALQDTVKVAVTEYLGNDMIGLRQAVRAAMEGHRA